MIKTAVSCGVEPVDILLLPKRRIVLLPSPSHLPAMQSCFSLIPYTEAGLGHTLRCVVLIFNKNLEIFAVVVEKQIAFCHLSNLLCLRKE